MRRTETAIFLTITTLAACGRGGTRVSIRGDFVDTTAVPTSVFAVEAGQSAEVTHGAFELRELGAGPVTLRLVRDADTVATLSLQNVPAGTELRLHGLETDGPTRRAFPRSLAVNGPSVLVLNGIRMARGEGLPERVDARGTVLAASGDRAALLVRPNDAWLPDLRVVVGLGTETMSPDSAHVEPATIARGDSVRVEGRTDNGFVVASRITTWRRTVTAMRDTPARRSSAEETSGASPPDESPAPPHETARAAGPAAPARVVVPMRVRREVGRAERGRGGGRGRGNGRGHAKKG